VTPTPAPLAARFAVEAVNRGRDLPLSNGASLDVSLRALAPATDRAREKTTAFLGKRKPSFTGKESSAGPSDSA
jgi:enoyl-CoA hydratase